MHQGYDQKADIIIMGITCIHHLASPAYIEVLTER